MFSSSAPAEHALNVPCRRIAALKGDPSHHRFLVGTCVLPTAAAAHDGDRDDDPTPNELHLLRFHEDLNESAIDAAYEHPTGEVWDLSPVSTKRELVLTVGGDDRATVLWETPPLDDDDDDDDDRVRRRGRSRSFADQDDDDDDDDDDDRYRDDDDESVDVALTAAALRSRASPMEERRRLPTSERNLRVQTTLFHPDPDDPRESLDLITLGVDGTTGAPRLSRWDLDQGPVDGGPTTETTLPTPERYRFSVTPLSAARDPHHADHVAVAVGPRLRVHDTRAPTTTTSDGPATAFTRRRHRHDVTCLDYNPNRPHVLVTGGGDGLVKFWDLRADGDGGYFRNRPLKIIRGGHSHRVAAVLYNPFHDQLVLSTGLDSVVDLWRASSVSSSPLLESDVVVGVDDYDDDDDDDDDPSTTRRTPADDGPDARVGRAEHRDAVYDAAWSACDAWVWASVGADGGVLTHRVPSKEKYKILL